MKEKRYLADVGMKNLPFPMKVMSKTRVDGQPTIANISINARIMQEFEAGWIDRFVEILHQHRDRIGTKTLKVNIKDYLKKLHASTIRIDFDYPYFIEKLTPVSREKCLVRYPCTYSAKISSVENKAVIIFKIQIPTITTYPVSTERSGGLFGQLSVVEIEVESKRDIYPEDLVRIVDRHALVPVYSFLTREDQDFVIQKIHSEKRTSVVMTDEIKDELAHNRAINWYSIRCSNFGMLHSYSTVISTEKSAWIPWTGYDENI